MPELQEVLESIQAEAASVGRIFGDAGVSVRSVAESKRNHPRFMAGLVETARILAGVRRGNWRDEFRLREAMTTSDFPLYFGDILDRSLITKYQSVEPSYPNYTQMRTVKDFRTANIFTFDGAEAQLDLVPEQTEYPAAKLLETRYQVSVQKHGRRFPISWESLVNDDQGQFDDLPDRFVSATRRSQEKDVTKLFVDASGPHATIYTAGNKNIINATNSGGPFTAVNPPLSIAALQQGMAVLARQLDLDNEPIVIEAVELVVGPALEFTARNILNAEQLWVTTAAGEPTGGTAAQQLHVQNWMKNRLRLAVNPYIPIVASTANGGTSWFLFARPAPGSRAALIYADLRGHVGPELFMKEPNQRRIGGGTVNPLEGDFVTDTSEYKVRATWGTARGDPKMTAASNGSGA
jgi:hypothetical protein